jgi:hypothetical protein
MSFARKSPPSFTRSTPPWHGRPSNSISVIVLYLSLIEVI